jgi:hypothetical protein
MSTHDLHRVSRLTTRALPLAVAAVAVGLGLRALVEFPGWDQLLLGALITIGIAVPALFGIVAAFVAMDARGGAR